ncbi:hypothetical protein ACFSCZ_07305 [Siminovitchia sediminis]|uniref:Uncharacterized protein n=1 Tax=Siminovitchia sediminis TaxID=1274353 RepID=A0ABW4KG85_9BACI
MSNLHGGGRIKKPRFKQPIPPRRLAKRDQCGDKAKEQRNKLKDEFLM